MSVEYELPISSLVSARKHLPPSYHHTIIDSLNHHIVISTLLKISTTALLSCFSQSFHFSEWQRNRIASVRSMSLGLSCPLLTENKRETLYIFLIFMFGLFSSSLYGRVSNIVSIGKHWVPESTLTVMMKVIWRRRKSKHNL